MRSRGDERIARELHLNFSPADFLLTRMVANYRRDDGDYGFAEESRYDSCLHLARYSARRGDDAAALTRLTPLAGVWENEHCPPRKH